MSIYIQSLTLDDLDTKSRIAHDVVSESGSQNEVEDLPKRSRGQWRPGTGADPGFCEGGCTD